MTAIRVPSTEVAPAAMDRPVATVTIVIMVITTVGVAETIMIGTDGEVVASLAVTTVVPLQARPLQVTRTVTGNAREKTTGGRAARLKTNPVKMKWMKKS